MKNASFLAIIFLFIGFSSCQKERDQYNAEYFMFGQFYGFCPSNCSNIYKISNDELKKDTKKEVPTRTEYYVGNFTESQDFYDEAIALQNSFPTELWNEKNKTFGCPDCVDQGGIYIEYSLKNKKGYWIFDTNIASNPDYLQDYLKQLRDLIEKHNN